MNKNPQKLNGNRTQLKGPYNVRFADVELEELI